MLRINNIMCSLVPVRLRPTCGPWPCASAYYVVAQLYTLCTVIGTACPCVSVNVIARAPDPNEEIDVSSRRIYIYLRVCLLRVLAFVARLPRACTFVARSCVASMHVGVCSRCSW